MEPSSGFNDYDGTAGGFRLQQQTAATSGNGNSPTSESLMGEHIGSFSKSQPLPPIPASGSKFKKSMLSSSGFKN
jgi:hypothetical protein